MNNQAGLRLFLSGIAIATCLIPVASLGKQPTGTPQYRLSRDVQLDKNGLLNGQLINIAGEPVANTTIEIRHRNQRLDVAITNEDGEFRLRVNKTGAYLITVSGMQITCRCWTATAAPPAATDDLVLMSPEKTVRGQRPFADIITNPLFVGAVIATAVAIPIAVSTSDGS
jgi:hypothetical protein